MEGLLNCSHKKVQIPIPIYQGVVMLQLFLWSLRIACIRLGLEKQDMPEKSLSSPPHLNATPDGLHPLHPTCYFVKSLFFCLTLGCGMTQRPSSAPPPALTHSCCVWGAGPKPALLICLPIPGESGCSNEDSLPPVVARLPYSPTQVWESMGRRKKNKWWLDGDHKKVWHGSPP